MLCKALPWAFFSSYFFMCYVCFGLQRSTLKYIGSNDDFTC